MLVEKKVIRWDRRRTKNRGKDGMVRKEERRDDKAKVQSRKSGIRAFNTHCSKMVSRTKGIWD